MSTINWKEIPEYEIITGLFGKFVHKEKMTIVKWRFNPGVELPSHNHPHEQLTILEEGSLELQVGDTLYYLKPGDMIPIPSNITHSGKSIDTTIAIDIFSPVREDLKEKYP